MAELIAVKLKKDFLNLNRIIIVTSRICKQVNVFVKNSSIKKVLM